MNPNPHVVVLAAGQGKRMHSKTAKVLHPLLFRPMIHYVLDSACALSSQSLSMVVGHGGEEIARSCGGYPGLRLFRQELQLGTADALKAVEPFLGSRTGDVLVLSGDVPLLSPTSLKRLLERHLQSDASCTLGTTTLGHPNGYGRVLRSIDGSVVAIREEADCSPAERSTNEVNAGIYCFRVADLFSALKRVGNDNVQHEFYLPDVVNILHAGRKRVVPYSFGDPMEVVGINDRHALWKVEAALQERVNRDYMSRGVTFSDPRATLVDPRCRIGEDVAIEAGCLLVNSVLEDDVRVEAHCRITDSVVGGGSLIRQGSYLERSQVGPLCRVGPYAHLRPETRLGKGVRIGNFVEVKKSSIGEGSKAAHLSYIGDAEIGRGVNIGCGFITCNYDGGPEKLKTAIEDEAFVGSDCQAVAPVRLGRGSYVAAGTTVTLDVPAGALAISRGHQTNKEGYARRLRRERADAGPEQVDGEQVAR